MITIESLTRFPGAVPKPFINLCFKSFFICFVLRGAKFGRLLLPFKEKINGRLPFTKKK